MERLAFQRDQTEITEPGARLLRAVVIANAVILVAGIVLAAVAPAETAGGAGRATVRALEDGARPQPGRRF